jgi:CBS domain-containing protein
MSPILVRDLMTVGVPTCKTSTLVVEAARFILEHNIEEMVVLDEEGQGLGVCGYEQLVSAYCVPVGDGREDVQSLTAENVMREGVPELPADITIILAAQMMRDKGVRVAYMVHNAGGITYPAAMISYKHILRALAAKDEKELKDLGISAERKSPIEQFIERRDEARRRAGLIK